MKTLDFKILQGLFINAIYGGRVDNPTDVRVLDTFMELLFKADSYKGLQFPKNQIEQRFFL